MGGGRISCTQSPLEEQVLSLDRAARPFCMAAGRLGHTLPPTPAGDESQRPWQCSDGPLSQPGATRGPGSFSETSDAPRRPLGPPATGETGAPMATHARLTVPCTAVSRPAETDLKQAAPCCWLFLASENTFRLPRLCSTSPAWILRLPLLRLHENEDPGILCCQPLN